MGRDESRARAPHHLTKYPPVGRGILRSISTCRQFQHVDIEIHVSKRLVEKIWVRTKHIDMTLEIHVEIQNSMWE